MSDDIKLFNLAEYFRECEYKRTVAPDGYIRLDTLKLALLDADSLILRHPEEGSETIMPHVMGDEKITIDKKPASHSLNDNMDSTKPCIKDMGGKPMMIHRKPQEIGLKIR